MNNVYHSRAMDIMRIAYSVLRCRAFGTSKTGFVMLVGLPAMLRTRPQRWRVATAGRVALLAGLLWLGVIVSRADTHYVSLLGTNDSVNKYNTWAGAATQIQWAVDAATNGETTLVSNGTYNLTNQIVITNAITLYGFYGRDATIVNGNYPAYSNRCFWISNINALVAGFTITNGYINGGSGGGAQLFAGCISNCIITGNTITNFVNGGGGGVYCASTSSSTNSRIVSCRIEGNTAVSTQIMTWDTGGGGVWLSYNGMMINCQIIGNSLRVKGNQTANIGGGGVDIKINGAIYNSQIISNVADVGDRSQEGGGGIRMQDSPDAMVCNSTIIGNTNYLGCGGGVNAWYGGNFRNCIISGNGCGPGASSGANGIWMRNNSNSASMSLENCTIMNNRGAASNGIVFIVPVAGARGAIVNCIVQSNYSSGVLSNWSLSNTNLMWITNSCIYPTSFPDQVQSSGCIESDPKVIDLAGGNYRLSANSPCINAGVNQRWMTNSYDLDGRTRIRYGIVDMGAYERINEGAIFTVH